MGELGFLDYDKITDTLMYLSNEVTLNFCVSLTRKSQRFGVQSFHQEYCYQSQYLDRNACSIKRYIQSYFIINQVRNYDGSVILRHHDVVMLQFILDQIVLPWFVGQNRIFVMDPENHMTINGPLPEAEFPVSDHHYLKFYPILCTYRDGTSKEGLRMELNDPNNVIDMDVNRFLEFYYYIKNTDMYNAAIGMLNYVKMAPYGINQAEIGKGNSDRYEAYDSNSFDAWNAEKKNTGRRQGSFFDKV